MSVILGKDGGQFTSIGGQAVIEGVMMRSPNFVSVAVRKPDAKIAIRFDPYSTILRKYPILRKPVLRGVATLFESMIQGMKALGFSAEVSGEEDEKLSKGQVAGSMTIAIVAGLALFVGLPHMLTVLVTSDRFLGISVDSPIFHFIDGCLKMAILLSYMFLISRMKEIARVFQYHGAEHKAIYAFEAGEPLTIENARKYTTLHPRCGTSFLLFLVLISIVVFSIVLPMAGLTHFSATPWINHLSMILVKAVLMFPVAGIAYEFIKFCAFRMDNAFFRGLIWPGLVLQKLTTKEPDDQQLEVALASLRQVLYLEKTGKAGAGVLAVGAEPVFEIAALSEIRVPEASVKEFLEA